MKRSPKIKRIVYTVRPDESAARLAVMGEPEGYRFWKLVRTETSAVVYYRRIEEGSR